MVAPIKVSADDPELKDAPMIVSQDDPDLQDVPAPIKVSADDPELKPVGDHISLIDAIDQNTGGMIATVKGIPSNLSAAGKMALGDVASMSVRAIEFANNPFKGLSQKPDDLAAYADEVNRATAQIEQEAAQQDVAAGRPEFFGKTARGVTRSLATAAPMGMALGPVGAIGSATLIQGSQSATEALDAGIPEGERARFVAEQMMWEGLPATLMQRIGLGGLESQLGTLANPAKRGILAALKQFGVSSLQELPEEYVTALGQAVSRVASGIGKPEEIGPDGIYNLMRDVTAQTLGTTGLVSASRYRPASQAPATPTPQPSQTSDGPPTTPQDLTLQPEPQYEQTYEQEFGDVWADLAQETPQAQPAPTPSPAAEVAPQATVAPIATPSETPEQFAERVSVADQMSDSDSAYYRENQAAVDEALRQMYDQYAEVDAVDEEAQQPAESEVIPSEEKGQEAEVLTEPQAVATPEPPAPQQPEATPEYAPEPAAAPTAKQPLGVPRTAASMFKGESIERMRASAKPAGSGWLKIDMDNGAILVHPSEDVIVPFATDSKNYYSQQKEKARADIYASENPVALPAVELHGELITRPIFSQPTALSAPDSPATTPIRFKHSGKGDTAVYEASIEGRAVTISKGKDGWEVRLDGRVKDVRPTIKAARDYAKGDLRQDLMDERNAREDTAFESAPIESPRAADRNYAAMDDATLGSVISRAQSQGDTRTMIDALNERKRRRGPAPADTGIYRDLTAAAREGKRFVEALYPRIQPVLARIHAEAKSAVDFVRRAVAKIGEHIKPYARRFLADVRAVNKEFRQNPTRGSVPTPEMPKRGKVTGEARGAGTPKLPQGMAPDAQTRQAGVVQGYKEGVLRQQQDTRAMLDIARQVLPAKEWRAIAKAAMSISRMRKGTETEKRKALDRVLKKHLKDITHAKAISQTVKAMSKVKASMPKMEPSLKAAADQLINSFSVRTPTASTLQKAEEVLLDAASGETSRTRSPKAIKAAKSLINSFLDGRTLSDMETEEVVAIRDLMNRINQLHEGGLKIVKDRLNADKVRVAKTAQEIQDNSTKQYPEEDFKGGSKIRAAKDETKNTLNLALELGPPDSEVVKTFYQNPTRGERQRNKVNFDAHQSILGVMESLGLVKSGKFGSYKISDEALKMSPSMSGWMSRSRAGRWLGEKLGAVKPSIRSFKVEDGVIRLSDSERMFIYLLSRDGYAKSQLLKAGGNKIKIARNNSYHKMTPELMDDVVGSLSSNEKAVADAMFAYNNGPLREKINEFWRSMYGHDVFNETDHQSYRREIEGREPDAFGQSISNSYAENMSIVKQREGGTSPIIIDDAFAHWFAHVNKIATIIGHMKPMMDMRRALDNPDFKDAVVRGHKHGAQLLKELASRADFYGKISPKGIDPVQGFMRYFLRNTTGTAVATSPTANITAPMSVISAQTVIPISHLLKSTGKTLDEAAFNEMKQWSPTMYFIITDTGHRIIDSETAGIGLQRFYGNQKTSASEKVTTLLRYMNDIPAFQIWRAAKSWGQSKGLTGDALMEFTAEKAEEAYSRSQPDNAWGMQSGLKLKARENIYHALRSVYQGQTQKAFNQALEAWNVYRWSDRSAAAKAKLAKDVVMPTILQNLIYTMVFTATDYALASLKGDEEKKRKMREHPFMTASWNLIPSTIGIVPGSIGRVGSYLTMKMYEGLIDKPKGGGSISDPLLRNAEAAADVVYQAGRQLGNFTDGKRTDFTKLRNGILYILQTFSIPGRTIEDILEMVEANFK